jgi:hypothetical protein
MNSKLRFDVDYGHLLFIVAIACWVTWYWMSARAVSLSPENLLIIQPVSALILIFLACLLPQCLRSQSIPDDLKPQSLSKIEFIKIVGVMLAMFGLVYVMFTVGFDVGVLFFSVIVCMICGERRPLVVGIYAVATTFLMVKGYKMLISFPMPTLYL